MPIYEYACTACDHRVDILLGVNDPGPHFCPSCGEGGTMRKLFAPPTIHYKGSGWAKKDAADQRRDEGVRLDRQRQRRLASSGSSGSSASSSEASSSSSSSEGGPSAPASSGPGAD